MLLFSFLYTHLTTFKYYAVVVLILKPSRFKVILLYSNFASPLLNLLSKNNAIKDITEVNNSYLLNLFVYGL